MAARGILQNPGLFVGHKITQECVIQDWLSIKHSNFFLFHHHLVFMLDKLLTKAEKRDFNYVKTTPEVLAFIKKRFNIVPVNPDFSVALFKPGADFDSGSYFKEKVKEAESDSEDTEKGDDLLEGIDGLYV